MLFSASKANKANKARKPNKAGEAAKRLFKYAVRLGGGGTLVEYGQSDLAVLRALEKKGVDVAGALAAPLTPGAPVFGGGKAGAEDVAVQEQD
jgi:hypothetical protein